MKDVYFHPGEMLLPTDSVYLEKWACVACDQFTSQPEYWREAESFVGSAPSTLRLILPECDLGEAAERIPLIHGAMDRYLGDGTLAPAFGRGFVLVERATASGERVGLVGLLDLDAYDYRAGAHSPVRATEGTIEARIPPRLAVRRDAKLELSHVLMLIDDVMHSVIEPIHEKRDELELIYDFPLMLGGGHLRGYAVTRKSDIAQITAALRYLGDIQGAEPLLYAVGDGNHSLATAKACWEEIKATLAPEERENHPARYAMVEMENIHDDALIFEPIHRVVYGIDGDDLAQDFHEYIMKAGIAQTPEGDFVGDGGDIVCVFEGKEVAFSLDDPDQNLPVGTLQEFLDDFMARHPECRVDYVHGEQAARELASKQDVACFLLPALSKDRLFPTIRQSGALPRKTFSMGEAREKRYYMEARKIR